MRMRLVPLAVLFAALPAVADDWPQWMGPQRDNVWREDGILEKFPKDGPKVLWRTPIAGGYAGPAVAGGRVFVTDYVTADNVKVDNFNRREFSGTERVLCLDEKTGAILWKHEYPVKYTISYPAGPRCTPVVDGGKVYTQGAEGHLFCFEVATGKIVWSHDLKTKYGTKSVIWGYAAHPLIDGKKLFVLAGGVGSHIVAFDKQTGEEIWKGFTSEGRGYSPPTIVTQAGVRQLLLLTPEAVISADPETGKKFWSVPYTADNTSIIMSPILWKDHLFVAGFNNKNLMLKLATDRPGAEVLWQNKRKHAISPVNVQPFLEGDVVYGFDQDGNFYGVAMPSGDRLWSTSEPVGKRTQGSATAFLVKQGERFWFFTEKGDLTIGKLTPKGYEEIDRAHIIEPSNVAFGRDVVWCMPAFANKHLYVRNDQEIIAVDLSK